MQPSPLSYFGGSYVCVITENSCGGNYCQVCCKYNFQIPDAKFYVYIGEKGLFSKAIYSNLLIQGSFLYNLFWHSLNLLLLVAMFISIYYLFIYLFVLFILFVILSLFIYLKTQSSAFESNSAFHNTPLNAPQIFTVKTGKC